MFLADAAYLYLMLLNETASEGGDYRNGMAYLAKAKNRSFEGKIYDMLIHRDSQDLWLRC